MNITLKHNQPISYTPRRLDFSETEELRKIIDEGVKNRLMRPSNSPYAIPIILVKMAESSMKNTSFVMPLGQYEFLRMPFGLTNTIRVFQRFIYRIFEPLIRQSKVLLYLDDILITTYFN